MWLIALNACVANIDGAFEAARDFALEAPGAVPAGWTPDAAVLLSDKQLGRLLGPLVSQALDDAPQNVKIDGPLGTVARLKPHLDLGEIDVHGGGADRADLTLSGSGNADWTFGPAKGKLPFAWSVRGTLVLDLDEDAALEVTEVTKASLTIKGRKLELDASDGLEAWLASWVVDELPDLPLGELGGEKLPVRATRVRGLDGGLAIELLTEAAHSEPLGSLAAPSEGLEVHGSQGSLLDLARKQAFEEGPVTDETWIEPTALSLSADAWTLGLRVWRLDPGWWRDYTVTGTIGIEGGEVKAEAVEATEVAHSQGAAFAEPLALLATGQILQGIVDAAQYAIPAQRGVNVAKRKALVELDAAQGDGNAWVLQGSARWKRSRK